jgi:hypothetical protein
MMKRPLAIIATLIFLVSYFLPFMGYRGVDISLFTILTAALQYGRFAFDILAFDLAFIAAIIGLITVSLNRGTKTRPVMVAGILGVVACALEIFVGGGLESVQSLGISIFEMLGIGFWLMILSSITMIVSHNLKEPEPPAL